MTDVPTRIYSDFNSRDQIGWCWCLRHDGWPLDDAAAELQLFEGQRVILFYGAAAGAEIVEPPYGDRIYLAKDNEGHEWYFAQHLRDVSIEDLTRAMRQ